jgi:hypothetical protein
MLRLRVQKYSNLRFIKSTFALSRPRGCTLRAAVVYPLQQASGRAPPPFIASGLSMRLVAISVHIW